MALLGSTIDPRLFVQDYSGYADAANTRANAMAGLGQTIAGGIERYGEEKKERKKLDAGIKASVTGIESAIKMGKSLGIDIESSLSPYLQKINDPNISAVEAAAYAQEASNSISNAFNLGMKGRELTVQEGRYAQQDRASQAAAYIDANKLTLKNIDAGGRTGVPVLINAAGDMFSATNRDPIVDLFAYANGTGGTLTNNSVPDLTTDPNVPTPDPNFDYDQIPTVPGDAVPTPDQQVQAGLNAGKVNSNTPVSLGRPLVPDKPQEAVKIVTGKKAEDLGLKPENTYQVKSVDGNPTDYTVLDKAAIPTADAEKANESSLRAASDAAYAIETVNELTSSPGFSDVFGVGFGFKHIPGTVAYDAEASREAIIALATTDSMRKFQGLGSMSDAEFSVARSAATQITKGGITETKAAEELNRLRDYFSTSIRRAEELGRIPKGTSDKLIDNAMAKMKKADAEKSKSSLNETQQLRQKIKSGY